MKVDTAQFELLAEPPVPEWIIRVSGTGSGFVSRAVPIVGRVGAVPVEGLLNNPDENGFIGYLSAMPADGDHLFIGFADRELIDTDVKFEAPPNV